MHATRVIAAATVAAAIVVGASCAPPSAQQPTPTVCDGVSADAGGCTDERHSFVGTSCDELAREWATFVDRRISEIIAGPTGVGGEAKSVRLKRVIGISSVDMNQRMRTLGLQAECSVDGVLAIAEPLFSETLRGSVGVAMFDGDPIVGYDDWITDVRGSLQVIDDED